MPPITLLTLTVCVLAAAGLVRLRNLVRDQNAWLERQTILFQNARDIILLVGLDGTILDANQTALDTYGYSHDELCSLKVYHLRHNEDRELIASQMKEAAFEGALFETVHFRKDGSSFPVEVSSVGATIKKQRVLVSIVRDISERLAARRLLQLSEEKYRTTLENTGTAMLVAENDTTITLANRQMELLTGYTKDEIEGKMSWTRFVSSHDLPRMMKYHRQRRADSGLRPPKVYEFQLIDRCGQVKDVLCTIEVVAGTRQSVASWLDITEAKKVRTEKERLYREMQFTQEVLRQTKEQLDTLVRACPLPIVSLDPRGYVTEWNPSAEKMFGWRKAEVLGSFHPAVAPDRQEEFAALLSEVQAPSRDTDTRICRYRTKQGQPLDVNLWYAPLYDTNGSNTGTITVLMDVTERSRFLQVASHELRNPMTALKALSSLLRYEAASGRSAQDLSAKLQILEKEIDRLSTLSGEILEAFRIQEGHLKFSQESVDLVEVVHSVLAPFVATPQGHEFQLCIDDGEFPVMGDSRRLTQVVQNLVGNAIKYSPSGGTITVKLQETKAGALLVVRDEGVGIPPEELPWIFESFYRAKNAPEAAPSGGMGLGLYICRDIVHKHNGRIWAESRPGVGSTFFIELPMYSRTTQTREEVS